MVTGRLKALGLLDWVWCLRKGKGRGLRQLKTIVYHPRTKDFSVTFE